MTVNTIAPPTEILAGEPNRKRGTKSRFQKEGDRTYTLSWKVGEIAHFDEPWSTCADLTIHHYKASESRRGAHYRAELRRVQYGPNVTRTTFNGTNGDTVLIQTEGAGRFNEAKFLSFVEVALTTLRHKCECEPRLLSYFDPHQEV